MSFYFKSPTAGEGLQAEHDLFVQAMELQNALRRRIGAESILHP